MKTLPALLLTLAIHICSNAAQAEIPTFSKPTIPSEYLENKPEISSAAYIAIDLQSRQILIEHNPDSTIEPAALTQLMTALLVFKQLKIGNIQASQMFDVPQAAWSSEGSKIFLRPHSKVDTDTLLKGITAQSANDAAITLAHALGKGSPENFVAQMNQEAKRLGMAHTHFQNPTGLSEDKQISTVRDLATLSATLILDYPEYHPLFALKSFKYNNIEQVNRNLLLYRDDGVDGLKAGHTESAGYNLAATANRNGRRILIITAGAESPETRASDGSKLLNWAFKSFHTSKIYPAGKTIAHIQVTAGNQPKVTAGFNEDIYLTLPKDATADIHPVLESVQPISAPIRKGQILGKLKLRQNGVVIAEKEITALENVEKGNWLHRFWDYISSWF